MLKKIFPILLISIFFSCQTTPKVVVKDRIFFDLKTYFLGQLEEMNKIKKINKITFFDGVEEEKIIDAPDFKQELALFIDSDINKNAWADKYEIDSLLNNRGLLIQISYNAIDQKMKTQSIDIFFEQESISQIKIFNQNKNAISNSEQHLEYLPNKGYSISNTQLVSFSPEHSLRVSVRYLE